MGQNDYLEELFSLEKFVELCLTGLHLGAQARSSVEIAERVASVLRKPAPYSTIEAREKALERASKLEVFAQSEAAQGYPYLYGLAAIKMWALLEAESTTSLQNAFAATPHRCFRALDALRDPCLTS